MSIIFFFPLRARWLAQAGCILGSFAIEFSICAKKKKDDDGATAASNELS